MTRMVLPRPAAFGVATAAVLALTLSACGSDDTTLVADSSQTPTTEAPQTSDGPEAESDSPSPTPSVSAESDPSKGSHAAGLYFAGTNGRDGVSLFREFRALEAEAATDAGLTEAALLIDAGETLDPDYRTLWPGFTVTEARKGDGVIEVLLNEDAFTQAPDGMSERDAELALQQMVHTLQGMTGSTTPVQFVRSTGPETLFGLDISKPVERAAWDDTLAFVNITSPTQGATVTGAELRLDGRASAHEATIGWRIVKGTAVDAEPVARGFATAEGWMDKLYPFETTIDVSELGAGEYTVIIASSDEMPGEPGGPDEDSRTFTVR